MKRLIVVVVLAIVALGAGLVVAVEKRDQAAREQAVKEAKVSVYKLDYEGVYAICMAEGRSSPSACQDRAVSFAVRMEKARGQ